MELSQDLYYKALYQQVLEDSFGVLGKIDHGNIPPSPFFLTRKEFSEA